MKTEQIVNVNSPRETFFIYTYLVPENVLQKELQEQVEHLPCKVVHPE